MSIVAEKAEEIVAALRVESGRDIWVFGGGSLFSSLLDAKLVDSGGFHHSGPSRWRSSSSSTSGQANKTEADQSQSL